MAEPLGQMMIELGLDDTKFGNGLKNAKSQLKYFGSEMKAQASFYDAFGSKVDGLSAKEQGLTKMIAAQSKVVAESKKAYDGSLTSKGEMTKSSARLAANFESEQAKLASLAKQYISTAQAEAEMSVKTTGVTGAINKLGTAQIAIGNRMKSLGDSMTTSITVPIATAFAAATAKAIGFQNKLLVIKNLLTTGGESAQEAISGVNRMQSDAIQYSNHYGVSVSKIADGYEELVRRGYTSKQAIAAMKTELQGALASGDDFNDVVSVASSTLESFGMKSNNTAKMTRNTKTAVNELAYAADLTATDFQSLGVGMSYVGATAHQAHFTLSETASALGVLSNNGVEADKAGTGLRKVIVSLNTAVKNIGTKNDVLASLGIKKEEIVGSNGQLKSLSTVMDVLNQHTKDMSATKKAAVFNSLFGTTGQQAGIILAQNSKQLAELNSQVDKAEKKNYVGSLSEKNLKSAQNQLKVLKQNVENLGMTLAQKVLPSVQPLIKDATQAVNWFSKLNPAIQQNIIKWGALAAAMGPVLSITGRFSLVSGKIKTGLIGLVSHLAGLNAKAKATQDVMATLTDGTGKTIGVLSKSGGAAEKTALSFGGLSSKLVTTTEGAGGLGFALTPLGIGLAATAAAAVVAGVAWEAWGKKAYDAQQRANQWGSDIGKTAGDAASSMTKFQRETDIALDGASGSAEQNAKKINSAFSGMITSAQKASDAQAKAANKIADEMGGSTGSAIEKQADREEKAREKQIAKMKDYAAQEKAITKQAADDNVALTADQQVRISYLQTKMAEAQVKTLGISAKQQKQVLMAELNDTSNASKTELAKMMKSSGDAAYQEQANYQQKVRKLNSDSDISASVRRAGLEAAEAAHNAKMNQLGVAYINAAKAHGKSNDAIMDDLTQNYGFTADEAQSAFAKMRAASDAASKAVELSTAGLSGNVKKAADTWNGLVLDPKTGKVKTNAVEEVAKGIKSEKTWNAIQLDILEGHMTSNAKTIVAEAAIQAGKWNDLTFEEQKMLATTNTSKVLMQALSDTGKWDALTPKTQMLIATAKTKAGLNSALKDLGVWGHMKPAQKDLLAHAKTAKDVYAAMHNVKGWNSLPAKVKDLIAHDYASANARAAYNAVKNFMGLPAKTVRTIETHYQKTGAAGAARALEGKINSWYKKKGTNDFQGGPAIVNDQKGPLFREAIIHKNGFAEIPFGRNVVRYVEKHAQIIPAGLTAKMFSGLPQFASGYNVPANAKALTMADSITQSLSGPQTINVNALNSNAGVETILDSIKAMLAMLMQRETTIDMDGRTVAQVQYPYLSTIDAQQKRAKNRRKGYTG
ncbi:phage tail tape measure protein [Lactobacillus acetotolerans]|uniref:phage tail tape measure protein n=1 Tax=Lactobacillus acetotolerans TaxID=1600 RepID=UPI002FDA6602